MPPRASWDLPELLNLPELQVPGTSHAGASQAPPKKPGTASNLSGRPFRNRPLMPLKASHTDPGPDKIVVQDWEHPVRAPSTETKGLEPPPNPNWHSSGLDKSSLQTQIQLFKIGSIQSRRRLKQTKGLEPPPNPNWHPSGLDKSSLQTQIKLFEIGSIQSGHRLKKTKGLEPPPNPNWHLWS